MSKTKRIVSFVLTFVMLMSMFAVVGTAQAATVNEFVAQADTDTEASSASYVTSADDFSWDNASVYFLLTDRFYNGNTSNDHSYGRSLNQSGAVSNGKSDAAAFHGGDFAGITQKIEAGYFDDLGVNALWISAPYEQMHGYCIAGSGKSGSFPHYSYHGYYALDFSETDLNFGTEEEFEKMVDTAHEHGIRIVLDVVMNHVGYNTIGDMAEYGFGTLKSGWETGYYNATLTNVTYHQYIDYNSNANDWAKWWGTNWLRAGLAGYTEGSGDLQGGVSYLPDIRTESTNTVDIPAILKTKWTKEGTLATKQAELNNYFATGKSKTVRNYMVFWLTQWVEKYGVDGFRCDTAKHVELESWKALKEQGLKSLQTWRKNNPTKPGANWDEDFWMTGECYTHYVNYDSYYTSGGFDSMINFSFNDQNSMDASASGMPAVGSINSTYADYAGKLNTNDKFNVLTYLSSHDTRLCRNNLIWQGSAFQLLPGGIQIYYGDETNRPLADGLAKGNDHALRSDMNWNSIDQNVLAHWQKVGQFRNNHVAVGAGSHTSLTATSGAAFSRNFNKNGVTDTVVACIGANANQSVTITLNGAFADGTTVKNTYDGTTATVSGGKVTFNSGANGTILVENAAQVPTTEPTTVAPVTTVPPTTVPTTKPEPVYGEALVGDVNLDGKINILDSTLLQRNLAGYEDLSDNQNKVADTDGDGELTMKDASNIQCYIVELKVTGSKVGTTTQIEVTPTVPPTTVPPVTNPPVTDPPVTNPPVTDPPVTDPPVTDPPVTDPPVSGQVKFTDNQGWGTVYAYFWSDSQTDLGGTWPGVQMTWLETNEFGQDVYVVDIPAGATSVVFNNNSDKTVDITLSGAEGYWTDGTRTDGYLNAFAWGDNPIPTDPTDPIPSGNTVKFTDNQNWGTVYAYFWGDSPDLAGVWPGTQMTWLQTNEYGENVYVANIPSGAHSVVFTNNAGSKTVDITLGAEGYYTDGTMTDGKLNAFAWGDNPNPTDPTDPTPSGGTIEFTDNQGWGKVFAYFWSDSQTDIGGTWPGQQMGNGYDNGFGQTNYSISIPAGAMYVIFSNGNGDQTVDLTLSGVTGYYTDGTRTDGKLNAYSW